jgi:uncharacterized membrane protein
MSADSANVYHLVAFAFDGQGRAKEVVKEVKKSGLTKGLKTLFSVIMIRDENGKVKFSSIKGMSGKKGAGIGAGAGALLAILGSGGVLLPVVVGGAVGKGIATRKDKKELSGELQELTDAMPDDSSAILAVVQDKEAESLINDMDGFNADVVTITLGDEASGMVESLMMGEFEIDEDLLEE